MSTAGAASITRDLHYNIKGNAADDIREDSSLALSITRPVSMAQRGAVDPQSRLSELPAWHEAQDAAILKH